jgi:CheY-like chemotaxis protein
MDRPVGLRELHVLIIDDDLDCLEMLATMLSSRGALVSHASSARAALEMLRRIRPNLIVSDIGMPREDGVWFIRQFEKLALAGPKVPVIALTAFDSMRQHARVAGFDAVLMKPLDPAAFYGALRMLGLAVGETEPLPERRLAA